MLTRGYYTCGCGVCRRQSSHRRAGSPWGRKALRDDANRQFRTRSKARLNQYVAGYDAEHAYDAEWEAEPIAAGYWD